MTKETFTANNEINEKVGVGQTVKLIDGSSLTCIKLPEIDFYITNSYKSILGVPFQMLELEAKVIETGITDKYASGVLNSIYLQDIIIEINNVQFRTSSRHIQIVEEETYRRGDRFLIRNEEYILIQTYSNVCCLVCLKDGNRFVEPIIVSNNMKISQSEIDIMAGSQKAIFFKSFKEVKYGSRK